MCHNFYVTNTEKQRCRHAAAAEKIPAAALESSDDDTSSKQMKVTMPNALLVNDQPSSSNFNTTAVDNQFIKQPDNAVHMCTTSSSSLSCMSWLKLSITHLFLDECNPWTSSF